MSKCMRCNNNPKTKLVYNSKNGSSICRYYYPEDLCDYCIKASKWGYISEMEELNIKINNLIEKYERKHNCKLRISIYNGDKIDGDYEYEGDKVLLESEM